MDEDDGAVARGKGGGDELDEGGVYVGQVLGYADDVVVRWCGGVFLEVGD